MPPQLMSAGAGGTVKRGGALAIAGQFIKLVLQLGSMAILARLLSPADFGLVSLVMPIVAFFFVFRDIGLTSATIYTEDITDAEVSSVFWINVVAGIALAGLLLAVAPLAARFYEDVRLTAGLSALALTFVCNGIAAQYQALLQRRFRFATLVAVDVGSNVAGAAVGVGAALLGAGYWALVLIPIVTQAVSLVATALVSSWQPGVPRWEQRTATMARFGSAIAGFNLLNYFARNLDNLLIGKFWGLEALGYYGRAYSLLMAPLSQIIYPLNQVVVPVLTRISQDREAYRKTYIQIVSVVMLVCVPLVTWLIVARVWIIDVLLGSGWSEVAPIFLALGFTALIQPINNSVGWLLVSQGRSRDVLRAGVLSCAVAVASILIGLPGGAVQVAACYSIGQILVLTPVLWWLAGRNHLVRAADLAEVALPFWIVATIAGFSFEALQRWVLQPRAESLSPLASLALSFVWVIGVHALLLALHPRSRRLLLKSAGLLGEIVTKRSGS